MRDAGVTDVVVHTSGFSAEENRQIVMLEQRGVLELVAVSRAELHLYRLKRATQ